MGSYILRRPGIGDVSPSVQAALRRAATSPGLNNSTIKAGATQVLDSGDNPRLHLGLYTFTTGPYAGQTVYAQVVQTAAGEVVLVVGDQPGGGDGLSAFDASGNERVRLGQLVSGDYGLSVTSASGVTQEILPTSTAEADTTINVTSGSPVAAPDGEGPSVSAIVGPSGKVAVTAGAYIGLTAAPLTGSCELFIDGSPAPAPTPSQFIGLSAQSSEVACSASNTRTITGLTAGSHTFELRYYSGTAGTGVNFSARTLAVQPL